MENLQHVDISIYNEAEALIHRLAQFPAIVGRNLTDQMPDDSNTTLNWDSAVERLESQLVNGEFRLSIHIPDFSLQWSKENEILSELPAHEKTKDEIFEWVVKQVENAGFDSSKLHFIDHYEVPEHAIDTGAAFGGPSNEILTTWMTHRWLANELMVELNRTVGIDSSIRVWPHHFDTGTYYAFGDKKAIGAGWAIGDSMSEYPYLYIYPWNADETIDLSNTPPLKVGKWMTGEWVGAILPLNEMIEVADLNEITLDFIKPVIGEFKTILKV